jgi:hypothetical protein
MHEPESTIGPLQGADRASGESASGRVIAYEYTLEDMVNAVAWVTRKGSPMFAAQQKAGRGTAYAIMIGSIASVIVAAVVGASAIGMLGAVVVGLLVQMIGFGVAMVHARKTPARLYNALQAQGALGVLPQPTRVWLPDEGVVVESRVGCAVLNWGAMHAVERADDHILLMPTSIMAHVVPARAFATPSDAAAFFAEVFRRNEEARKLRARMGRTPASAGASPG